jgi:hypothetical protein
MVLDRVHPIATTHHVDVDHHHRHEIAATEKVLARINALAAAFGLDPRKMPTTIDVTPERADDEGQSDAGA